jgi:hypothetical protein
MVEPMSVSFGLIPDGRPAGGLAFSAGSRIRLSIAAADDDRCGQVPHDRPPLLRILWSEDNASRVELPLRRSEP